MPLAGFPTARLAARGLRDNGAHYTPDRPIRSEGSDWPTIRAAPLYRAEKRVPQPRPLPKPGGEGRGKRTIAWLKLVREKVGVMPTILLDGG